MPSSHGGEGEVHGLLMRAFCRHSHPCHPPMLSQIARDMSLDSPACSVEATIQLTEARIDLQME